MKNLLLVLLCIPLMAFGWDSDADDKLKEKAKEKYIARVMDYRQQIAGLETRPLGWITMPHLRASKEIGKVLNSCQSAASLLLLLMSVWYDFRC